MIRTFTQNDLIRFIYQETTEEETNEINRVLSADSELQRQYRELLLVSKDLDKARLEPSSRVTDRIMNHVRGPQVKR